MKKITISGFNAFAGYPVEIEIKHKQRGTAFPAFLSDIVFTPIKEGAETRKQISEAYNASKGNPYKFAEEFGRLDRRRMKL